MIIQHLKRLKAQISVKYSQGNFLNDYFNDLI